MGVFITYAQNKEDVILNAFFSDVERGYYVDVGANDPVKDSVTKHFYDRGWRGIDIEPIRELCDLLKQNRPDDTVLNYGVSNKEGELVLRQYGNSGLSTFSDDLKKTYQKSSQAKTTIHKDKTIPVTTLKKIFSEHKVDHIHFMKIDVEGMEYEAIQGNDWSLYRPEMLCIEADHISPQKDWRHFIEKQQYQLVYNDGLNDYYLAHESSHRKDRFSYVDTILLGDQIMPFHVRDRINELENESRDKDIRLQLQKIHALQQDLEKANLEAQLREQRRLKSTIKLFVKAFDAFVLAYIEKLHKAKPVENRRSINGLATTYNRTSREALLRSVQYADLAFYYNTKPIKNSQKFYAYRAVKWSYLFVRHSASLVVRSLLGSRRRG